MPSPVPRLDYQHWGTIPSGTSLLISWQKCAAAYTQSRSYKPFLVKSYKRAANLQDSAQVDIRVEGFWEWSHYTFNVQVFNPFAQSNCSLSLTATYYQHEKLKRRAYKQWIQRVEHSLFTPHHPVSNKRNGQCRTGHIHCQSGACHRNLSIICPFLFMVFALVLLCYLCLYHSFPL